MAGTKISGYAEGDVNLTNVMSTLDQVRKGKDYGYSLTQMTTTTVPAIAAGSIVECNGALYKFDSEEAIGGSPSDGLVYIYLIPAGTSITAEFTNTAPTWSDSKQGWYGTSGSANYRYLSYSMIKATASYTEKNYIHDMQTGGLTGEIKIWPTTNAPVGYLLCYGQAVNRTTYARLFHVIGTTFGVGDTTTTFNLPDLRGRYALGKDNLGGSSANRVTAAEADTIGGVNGHEGIPYHRHGPGSGTHFLNYSGAENHRGSSTSASMSEYTAYAGDVASTNNMTPYVTMAYIIRY